MRPLTFAGERSNRRDAVREHLEWAEDDHLSSLLHERSSAAARERQLQALLRPAGRASEVDRAAARRLLQLGPGLRLDEGLSRCLGPPAPSGEAPRMTRRPLA